MDLESKGSAMNDASQTLEESVRRRQLEALFADEPFLSPTMRARRLHEKLQGMRNQEAQAAQAPETRQEASWLFQTDLLEESVFPPSEGKTDGEVRLSFAEAIALLRRPAVPDSNGISTPDRLRRFRMQVLPRWLENVSRREPGRRRTAGPPTAPMPDSGREAGEQNDSEEA